MPDPLDRADGLTEVLRRQYTQYPYPPVPVTDGPPAGWIYQYCYPFGEYLCSRSLPSPSLPVRVLEGGCGTGYSTVAIAKHNPSAHITAIDISPGSLAIARERLRKAGLDRNVDFRQLSILDAMELEGPFDFIASTGVVMILEDPVAGLDVFRRLLKPGGLMYIWVYGEMGRWEIRLTQQAIKILQDEPEDPEEGLHIGRALFEVLPPSNRLAQYAAFKAENNREDAAFVDMFVTTHERQYNVDTLFELLDKAQLDFVRFADEETWSLEPLLAQHPLLRSKIGKLSRQEQYHLHELLDPVRNELEFYCRRRGDSVSLRTYSEEEFLSARLHVAPIGSSEKLSAAERAARPDGAVLKVANYRYDVFHLNREAAMLYRAVDGVRTVRDLIDQHRPQAWTPQQAFTLIQQLETHRVLMLEPV